MQLVNSENWSLLKCYWYYIFEKLCILMQNYCIRTFLYITGFSLTKLLRSPIKLLCSPIKLLCSSLGKIVSPNVAKFSPPHTHINRKTVCLIFRALWNNATAGRSSLSSQNTHNTCLSLTALTWKYFINYLSDITCSVTMNELFTWPPELLSLFS